MITHKTFYPFLILIAAIFFSCSKDKSNLTNQSATQVLCVTVTGYTATNENAEYLGSPYDSSDWRVDDQWSQCEKDLFGGTNFTPCTFIDTLTRAIGFPNPAYNFGHGVSFEVGPYSLDSNVAKRDTLIKVDLLLVNQSLQKVQTINTDKYHAHLYFPLDILDGIATDTIFRIYYKITDSTGCVKMGHGDIVRR